MSLRTPRFIVWAIVVFSALRALPSGAQDLVAPTIMSIRATSPGEISLQWCLGTLVQTPTGSDCRVVGGHDGFIVQNSVANTNAWRSQPQDAVAPDVTKHTIANLAPSQNYMVRVCAVYPGVIKCSEPKGPIRTMDPEPPKNPKILPPPVVSKNSDIGPTYIGVRWDAAYDYDSYFVNTTEKPAPGQPMPSPLTIRHDDDGDWGYQLVEGLNPGRTYIVQVQGCTETFFGAGADHCHAWSQPVEFTTLPPPPPPRLDAPSLRVESESSNWVYLDWRDVPADWRIDRIVLQVDGRKHSEFAGNQRAYRHNVRPNSVYSYRLCIYNASGEACSDTLTGAGTPTPPAAPQAVTVRRASVARGGKNPSDVVNAKLVSFITLDWQNVGVPGRFYTVERYESRVRRAGGGTVGGVLSQSWAEVDRLIGKDAPASAVVPPASGTGIDLGGGKVYHPRGWVEPREYRVCALVPELPEADGKACSTSVTL